MSQAITCSGGLAVAGAATDARKTSGTAGYSTRARELPAGATADTRDTALATGATAGPSELSAGATIAVEVTAAATRILLEDTVGGPCAGWGANGGFSGRHGHHGNRCRSSPTDNQRFHEIEFLEHGHRWRNTPFHTCPKHRISVAMVDDVDDIAVGSPDEKTPQPPGFGGQWMDDVVAELLCLRVRRVDVIGADRNHRVFMGRCITGDQLEPGPGVGRGVPGHPAHVELFVGQPEVVGVETLGRFDVRDSKVGKYLRGLHAALLMVRSRRRPPR